jgi:hypothetical protein
MPPRNFERFSLGIPPLTDTRIGVRYVLEEFSMAKSESILSDFHEDKLESAPGSSSVKPEVAHEGSQVSSSETPTPEKQTKKTKDVKGSEKKNRSSS